MNDQFIGGFFLFSFDKLSLQQKTHLHNNFIKTFFN